MVTKQSGLEAFSPGERTLPDVVDTEQLGEELGERAAAGDLIILDGPLGAGKTALTRGIGRGLGVLGRVSSPTFIIAREHKAGARGVPMVHVDAYRLGGLDELDALDLDSTIEDGVVVVEWGGGTAERLAQGHLRVQMSREPDSEVRTARWDWIVDSSGPLDGDGSVGR